MFICIFARKRSYVRAFKSRSEVALEKAPPTEEKAAPLYAGKEFLSVATKFATDGRTVSRRRPMIRLLKAALSPSSSHSRDALWAAFEMFHKERNNARSKYVQRKG